MRGQSVALPERTRLPGPGGPETDSTRSADLLMRPFLAYARWWARYHRHEVRGLERLERLVREGRRVVLVGNHVMDVLDPLLFAVAVFDRLGRFPRFVGHENLVFRLPGLGALAKRYGMIPSRRMREAEQALRESGLLMIYPGSGSEAARRSYWEEPYRLKWAGRFGFLRLALKLDAELMFVAAVGVDEMYYQTHWEIPVWLLRLTNAERYRGSRMQVGLLGPHVLPTLVPLPVKIMHVVSPSLDLGDRSRAQRSRRALAALHRRIWAQCQAFLDLAVAERNRSAPLLDRAVRAGERVLKRLGV